MRTLPLLFIVLLCLLVSPAAHADKRHREGQATSSALRYLPGDSVKVWAYHGADFRQMAVSLWPGVSAPALTLPPMTAGQRQALARQWGMLAPEHNVVGGGDDPFTDGQAIPALIGSGTAAALWQLTGRANYIDYIERALYNAVLHTVRHAAPADTLERRAAAILLATAPGLIYATDRQEGTLYVNLYTNSTAHLSLGGRTFSLDQITPMPEQGTVKFRFMGYAQPFALTVRLRLPDWATNAPTSQGPASIGLPYTYVTPPAKAAQLFVNGHEVSPLAPDSLGYVTLTRTWCEGDEIYLTLPLQTRALRPVAASDQPVAESQSSASAQPQRGLLALQSGPTVYAVTPPADSAYLTPQALPTLSDSLNVRGHFTLTGHLYDLRHTPADAPAPQRPLTAEPYADTPKGTLWVREPR